MRVLFASDYPHIPENTGGTEINTHELSLALRDAGHEPTVLATLIGRGWVGCRARLKLKLGLGSRWAEDGGLGYPVLRTWNAADALADVIDRHRPDVVVVQSWRLDMVAVALDRGCGVVLYSHSANSPYADTIGGNWARRCVLLANSQFNARLQGEALGATFDVLHPAVHPDRYFAPGPRSRVLHVGLNQRKGAAITVAIARLRPDIPFTMVRTWEGLRPPPEDAAIIEMARALPNIEIMPAQRDPRRLYCIARIMLVPSAWDEAWGRVVTEAQLNGIPVVASDRGGLPESVGSGGILLRIDDDPSVWAHAVGQLWDDPVCHADHASRALRRARQPDVAFGRLRSRFFEFLDKARQLNG